MGRSELHSIPKQTIYNDKLYIASNDNRQQTAKTVKAHIVPNANIPIAIFFIRKLLSSNIAVGHMFYTKFIFT